MLNFRNLKFIPNTEKYISAIKVNNKHSFEPNYSNLENILKQSDTIFIRHANSMSNHLFMEVYFKNETCTVGDIRKEMFKYEQIDAALSEDGVQQCLKANKHASKINF